MDNLSFPAPEIGHKMTPEFAKIGTYLWFSICGMCVCAINCFASYTLDLSFAQVCIGEIQNG